MTGNEDQDRLPPAQSSHASLPHVEAIVPLDAPTAPPEQPAVYVEVRPKFGPGSIGAIAIGIVLIAAVVLGFIIWPRPPAATGSPVRRPGFGRSGKTSVSGDTTDNGRAQVANPAGKAQEPPTNPPSAVSGPTDDLGMAAYNEKLANVRRLLSQASATFAAQTDTLASEPDIDTAMDRAAVMWDTWARGIAAGASSLESISPPAQVASIHAKYADNIRQLSVLAEQASQAANAHDQTLFDAARGKIDDLEATTGPELTNMITSAGYDSARFDKDGTLVKKGT